MCINNTMKSIFMIERQNASSTPLWLSFVTSPDHDWSIQLSYAVPMDVKPKKLVQFAIGNWRNEVLSTSIVYKAISEPDISSSYRFVSIVWTCLSV